MTDATFETALANTTDSLPNGAATMPLGSGPLGILPEMRANPLETTLKMARENGDIVPFKLGFKTVYFLNHPDLIYKVFVENRDNYVRSKFYGELSPFLGDGLFTVDGQPWRRQRQTAQKSVSGDMLKNMLPVIAACTETLIRRIEDHIERGEAVNMTEQMAHHTLDVVMQCFFTMKLDYDEQTKVHGALTVILDEVERRIWKVLPIIESIPTPQMLRVRRALATVDELVYRLIDTRLQNGSEQYDLLSMFIDAVSDDRPKDEMRRLLRDQIISFMLAGHETGSNSMTWTFIELSRRPDVARAYFAEVDGELNGKTPEFDDLEKLMYTQQLYYEVLRFYPPGWAYSREAVEADSMAGVPIPAGAPVMLCAFAMQRHPRFWVNPEGFDPGRFSPENRPKVSDFAYFPFGGGVHACLGARFAMIEAAQTLGMLGQRFHFDLIGGQTIKPIPRVTLRPDRSVMMRARHRNQDWYSMPTREAAA